MEVTPRPMIVPIEYDDYLQGGQPWTNRFKPFFKWSQRDRALMRLFRTLQFKRLAANPTVIRTEIPREMQDPDPYDPVYVFYCMRLKGCSV